MIGSDYIAKLCLMHPKADIYYNYSTSYIYIIEVDVSSD